MSKKNEFLPNKWEEAKAGDVISLSNIKAVVSSAKKATARIKIMSDEITEYPRDIIVISEKNELFSTSSIRTNKDKTEYFLEEDDEIIFTDIMVVDNGKTLSYIVMKYEEL